MDFLILDFLTIYGFIFYITFKFILFSMIHFALKYTKVLGAEMAKSLYDGPTAEDLGHHKLHQGT